MAFKSWKNMFIKYNTKRARSDEFEIIKINSDNIIYLFLVFIPHFYSKYVLYNHFKFKTVQTVVANFGLEPVTFCLQGESNNYELLDGFIYIFKTWECSQKDDNIVHGPTLNLH